jgi:lysozyme
MNTMLRSIATIGVSAIVMSGCASKNTPQQSSQQTKTSAATTTATATANINSTAILHTSAPQQFAQNNYRTNQECVDIIKKFEGVRRNAYKGPGGHWLIGYGHKPNVVEGMTITLEKAEIILKADLVKFEGDVSRLVKVELNHNQFSALVCLAYNIGGGSFARSTLLRKLNSNDFEEAANQFAVWRMVKGQINSYQVKRRATERALFVQ